MTNSLASATVELEIPFHDIDLMEIAWHGHYAKYLEIARGALLNTIDYNVKEMLSLLDGIKSSITVFPELGVTAYTCNDLFYQESLLSNTKKAIQHLLTENKL